MNEYLEDVRENAIVLRESTDRITLEPLSPKYKHSIVALDATGRIQYWNTHALYRWITIRKVHPLLHTPLSLFQTAYITAYDAFLTYEEKNPVIDEVGIYELFIKYHGILPPEDMFKARLCLSPKSFVDRFHDYLPEDEEVRYERVQAEAYLKMLETGNWLLRYSSLNRYNVEYNKKFNLRYYVLSYSHQNGISHLLILHRPGWGWTHISKVSFEDGFTPVFPEVEFYKTCFVDILLHLVDAFHLDFSKYYST